MGSRACARLAERTHRPRGLVAAQGGARALASALLAVVAAGGLSPGAAQESQEAQPASPRILRLTAKLGKTRIVPYEPLWLTVTLKNISREPVLLLPLPGVPICRVEGPGSRPLQWGAGQQAALVASQTVLAGGEVRESRVELNHLFNLGQSAGRYKVIVVYPLLGAARSGRRGAARELKAGVSFRVGEPEQEADREALPDFRRAIEQHMAWQGRASEATRAAYEQVLRRHANSRYAEYAEYWLARSWHNPLDYGKAREAYREFISQHPRSGYADAARRGLEQLGALGTPEPGEGGAGR